MRLDQDRGDDVPGDPTSTHREGPLVDYDPTITVSARVRNNKPEVREAFLVIMAGADLGRVFHLRRGENLIGRDDGVGIQIVDHATSWRHARIDWNPDSESLQVSDLGSSNGTVVNGTRITSLHDLVRGDKIEIGQQTIMRISFSDEPETEYARHMYDAVLRDGLTGAFNRRYFDNRIVAEIAFATRHRRHLSLIFADLDHFKQVNDSHDHQCGDAVLKQFCELVNRTIRSEDVFARYGGEEFVLICRETDEESAAILAERIRHLVETTRFVYQKTQLRITVSLGLACLEEQGINEAGMLLEAADKALYRAKEGGRNRVVRHSKIDLG